MGTAWSGHDGVRDHPRCDRRGVHRDIRFNSVAISRHYSRRPTRKSTLWIVICELNRPRARSDVEESHHPRRQDRKIQLSSSRRSTPEWHQRMLPSDPSAIAEPPYIAIPRLLKSPGLRNLTSSISIFSSEPVYDFSVHDKHSSVHHPERLFPTFYLQHL